MDNSFYNISCKLLHLNAVCVDSKEFKKQLCSQETYPSLKSLTNVLTDFGIEHRALKIDRKQLQEYGTPVLLHYQENIPRFVAATHVTDQEITYYKSNLEKKTQSLTEFSQHWNGAALYVMEPEKKAFTCQLTEAFIKWSGWLILLLTIALLGSVLFMYPTDKWFYGLFLTKLIGLFFSILLLRHDWGKLSVAERHFCSLSKSINCDAVLSSSASRLFGKIKMSDISVVYFLGGFICLIIVLPLGGIKPILDILGLLSFCSLPYMLFSLSYQKFKVKKWCPLCLGVLSVLLIEISIGVIRFCLTGFTFPVSCFFYEVGLFLIWLALVWGQLNNRIKTSFNADENEIRYLTLKRNNSIFRAMLDRQPAQDMAFSEHDIILGKLNTPLIVTIAINPFCTPCLDLYGHLVTLLQKRPDVFRLNIRFMSMDEEEKNTQIGLTLMSMYYDDKEMFARAIDFWKNEKSYSSFIAHYGVMEFSYETKCRLKTHFSWREKLNIKSTPMIFINNKRLPEIYTEDDLFYFLQY